jgi:hypothetical protein
MGEKMSPNVVEKKGGKIEEYMVRAGKIVDSPNAWCVSDFWRLEGQPAFIKARFDVFRVTFQSGPSLGM